ncbi:MAG: carboxypeptidase regulatory-like domain-containing protein [Bacteroidota bacterium]|nr:carboxypeptidase regulatory-like domain-containing protein [Bacteroidota bacterium]
MNRIMSLVIGLLLSLAMQAQEFSFSAKENYTYIYSLDSTQAANYFFQGKTPVFYNKLDSFLVQRPSLAPGYYVLASYFEPHIKYEVIYIPLTSIRVKAFNGVVQVFLLDSTYLPDPTILFLADNKRVYYDTLCNCYPLARSKKVRHFYMRKGQAFSFGEISKDYKSYPITNSSSQSSNPVVSHGYFMLNQPKYFPKDSVKLKAFILNGMGVAYTAPLNLYLVPSYAPQQKLLLGKIKPQTKGAYVFQFKLPDSLKIDKSYSLVFEERGGLVLKSTQFTIEDYVLRNSTYSVQPEKTKYYGGEQIRFFLSARDANNLPITDAKVKLQIKLLSYTKVYQKLQFISNDWYTNLYEKEILLDISTANEILIPLTELPPLDMRLMAEISFSNSAGELDKKGFELEISQQPAYYSFDFADHKLKASLVQAGEITPCKAILEGLLNNTLIQKDTILLPFTGHIQQNVNAYILRDSLGNILQVLNLPNQNLNGSISGKRTHDSVFIYSENPNHFEFYYRIYRGDVLLTTGKTKQLNFAQADTSFFSYNVIYSWLYQGNIWHDEAVFTFKEKELTIKTNLPAQIYPGQSIPLDILVLNANRQPQEDVNLTSFGINGQFDNYNPPYLPYYGDEKSLVYLAERTTVTAYPAFGQAKFIYSPTYDLLLKTGLRKMGDYRLRYPNELFLVHATKMQKPQSEFVPMVVGNGRRIEVYYVEVNGNPVYVQNNQNLPRACPIAAGKNNIYLRTKTASYLISDFLVSDSFRYVFSFDTLCLPNQIIKMPSVYQQAFSDSELKKMKAHVLTFKSQQSAQSFKNLEFVQGTKRYNQAFSVQSLFVENETRTLASFGFFVEDTIQVFYQNRHIQKFLFDPSRHYLFFNGKVLPEEKIDEEVFYFGFGFFRNYDYTFNSFFDTLVYQQLPIQNQQIQVATNNQLKEKALRSESCLTNYRYSPTESKTANLTKLQLNGIYQVGLKDILFFHVLDVFKSELNPNLDKYAHQAEIYLYPGMYDCYFVSENNTVFYLKNFEVKENGVSLLRLDSLDFNLPCTVLNAIQLKAKQLQEIYKLRESVMVNYRKEDYVEVRERIPVQISASAESNPILSGFVFNQFGEILPNVIISLEQAGKVIGISFSDATGGFLIRDIPSGNYQIRLTRFGSCITIIHKISLQKNKLHHFNIRLQPCGFSAQTGQSNPTVYFGKAKMSDLDKNQSEGNSQSYINGTGIVKGRVADANTKRALEFVSISITQNGKTIASTMSDEDGAFIFKNISPGMYHLKSTYIGYSGSIIQNIGVEKDMVKFINFTMQASEGSSLQEVVVQYRKALVEPGGVRGDVKTSKEVMALATRSVHSVNSMVGRADGTSYYIDGVRVQESVRNLPQNAIDNISIVSLPDKVSFENEQKAKLYQLAQNQPNTQTRSVFRDYAFWVPNLVTNKEGEAHVTITFPDNITRWDNYFIAMNERLDTRVHKQVVYSYRPLSANLFIPSFALQGDRFYIKGKVNNYTGDSLFIQTNFFQKDSLLQIDSGFVNQGKQEQVWVQPKDLDTLAFSYQLKTNIHYADGERYLLPVFPNGMEQNTYEYYLLTGDSTLRFTTQSSGQYALSVVNSITQLLRQEMQRLQEYRHGCTEQTASKLNALLVEKSVCNLLGDSFTNESMIQLCLNRLASMQLSNGTFGWFSRSAGEIWLSYYVLKSLIDASKMGYKNRALEKGVSYFSDNLQSLVGLNKLRAIHLLAEARKELKYEVLLEEFKEENLGLYERLLLTHIKQKLNLPYFAGFLYEGVKRTSDGGIYWDIPYTNIYQNKHGFGLLAYEVLKNAHADSSFLAGLRMYYFNELNFSSYQNRNTLESAMVLQAMAKDLAKLDKNGLFPSLQLNGKDLGKKFPIKVVLPNNASFALIKRGPKTWVYLHRKMFVAEPNIDSSYVKIKTHFRQNNAVVNSLHLNQVCTYEVALNNLQNQEFIMVQIPIPAACSYANKGNTFGADEVEYHKDRIILFYRKFRAGNYNFSIKLEPRFAGNFSILPVQLENMYNPTVTGNAAKTELKIIP